MSIRTVVHFLGGVADGDNLTGSCTLLQINIGKKVHRFLLEAGLIQCRFREALERNIELLEKLNPESLDGIILTHGHIDHSGRIPLLVKNGFSGSIYCTEQTSKLLPIMLEDNAKILSHEAIFRNKKIKERQKNPKNNGNRRNEIGRHQDYSRFLNQPLYTTKHVRETCDLVKLGGYGYEKWIKLAKGIELKFYPSGHVLGGAVCIIKVTDKEETKYLGFTGDLGRSDGIILPPPKFVEEPIDYWFTESTYGGRVHPRRNVEISRLLSVVRTTAIKKGKIIIPSFALERTQEVIYLLSKHMANGNIPKMPIYLDSPMAAKITSVFSESWHSSKLFKGQGELNFNPFCCEENSCLRLVTAPDESSALLDADGPYIVVAGSGMCDAGRVRGHLRRNLSKPNTTICLVGYMTEGSLGRKLKERWPLVRMNDEEIPVKASIVSFESFSAHADSPFLCLYAKKVNSNKEKGMNKIFILHGERKTALDLKVELMETLGMSGESVFIPKIGESFKL